MKVKFPEITGVILAGGKSKRMGGTNKAFLCIDGIPFIERTLSLFCRLFAENIIVTNIPKVYQQYAKQYLIASDIIPNKGPLGGIHSGLTHSFHETVFCVACDMPFLEEEMIVQQINYFSQTDNYICVPRRGQYLEPLHGVYKKIILPNIDDFLCNSETYAVKNFLQTVPVKYWDVQQFPGYEAALQNVNTPQEWKKAQALMGGEWKK